MQNIKSICALLLIIATTIGMESELKQRLVTSNQPDTEMLLEQSTIEDCSICYEEKEVALIPCKMGEKHPKICSVCLDGCNERCPYCRSELTSKKNRNCVADAFYRYYNSDRLYLGMSGGCLYMYFYMMFAEFA